jgi:hypothetical protein
VEGSAEAFMMIRTDLCGTITSVEKDDLRCPVRVRLSAKVAETSKARRTAQTNWQNVPAEQSQLRSELFVVLAKARLIERDATRELHDHVKKHECDRRDQESE